MRPRVGVSSCLLGQQVRFDGGHRRHAFLTDVLGPHVDWVPFCPEMAIGLGTPRETLRLTAGDHLVNRSGTADHTAAMAALPLPAGIDGYVFKAKSPSCGIRGIPRYGETRSRPTAGARGVRRPADGGLPAAAGGGRGTACRPGAARGVHRADLRPRPAARGLGRHGLTHVRVAVVGRRGEQLLDRAGVHPADQVEDRTRLVVGPAGPGAAERLLPDHRARRLVVDVEIARGEPQRLGRVGDRRPVLRDDRAGQRVPRPSAACASTCGYAASS